MIPAGSHWDWMGPVRPNHPGTVSGPEELTYNIILLQVSHTYSLTAILQIVLYIFKLFFLFFNLVHDALRWKRTNFSISAIFEPSLISFPSSFANRPTFSLLLLFALICLQKPFLFYFSPLISFCFSSAKPSDGMFYQLGIHLISFYYATFSQLPHWNWSITDLLHSLLSSKALIQQGNATRLIWIVSLRSGTESCKDSLKALVHQWEVKAPLLPFCEKKNNIYIVEVYIDMHYILIYMLRIEESALNRVSSVFLIKR